MRVTRTPVNSEQLSFKKSLKIKLYDLIKVQKKSEEDLRLFIQEKPCVIQSGEFTYNKSIIGCEEDIRDVFSNIQPTNLQIQVGSKTFGGIFNFNWKGLHMGMLIFIGQNKMSIHFITDDSSVDPATQLLADLRRELRFK